MPIAALIGNGVSIAYNPELGVGQLTPALLGAFTALTPGQPASDYLRRYAAQVAGTIDADDPAAGFEDLLGPLDHVARALPLLAPLGAGQYTDAGSDIAVALETTQHFLAGLHRTGMGVVLRLIAGRAHGWARTPERRPTAR